VCPLCYTSFHAIMQVHVSMYVKPYGTNTTKWYVWSQPDMGRYIQEHIRTVPLWPFKHDRKMYDCDSFTTTYCGLWFNRIKPISLPLSMLSIISPTTYLKGAHPKHHQERIARPGQLPLNRPTLPCAAISYPHWHVHINPMRLCILWHPMAILRHFAFLSPPSTSPNAFLALIGFMRSKGLNIGLYGGGIRVQFLGSPIP